MKQKNIFLRSEGDAWFERNRQAIDERNYEKDDLIISAVLEISNQYAKAEKLKILEIGCGEARRLAWLAERMKHDVYGIEPSVKAVQQACSYGVDARQGTADELPFDSESFDILIFGFSLYLCDQDDLFKIAAEADRVLKSDAWLLIQDFYSKTPIKREYHHKPGVYSTKMDYQSLFVWHPAYTCYRHTVFHHSKPLFTDEAQEWVATTVMRKKNLGD